MEILIAVIISSIISSLITIWLRKDYKKVVGTLRIDSSDPEDEPYIFLELNKGVGDVSRRSVVTLKVSTKSYLSQK